MKTGKLLFLSMAMIVSFSAFSQFNDHHPYLPIYLLKENIKGTIKAIHEVEYEAIDKFGEVRRGKRNGWGIIYIFDSKGNIIINNDTIKYYSELNYSMDGKKSANDKWKAKYDNDNILIEKTVYHENGDTFIKYKYDKKGRIVEELLSGMNRYANYQLQMGI